MPESLLLLIFIFSGLTFSIFLISLAIRKAIGFIIAGVMLLFTIIISLAFLLGGI